MPRKKRSPKKRGAKSQKTRKFIQAHLTATTSKDIPDTNATPNLANEKKGLTKRTSKRSKTSKIKILFKILAWPFKINKVVLTCVLISIACIIGVIYLKRAYPISIQSSLTQVSDIEFSFRDFQIQNISPLCGCKRDFPADYWRGVTFATRHLSLERKGGAPVTNYVLSAAAPGQTQWVGSGLKFSAALYTIAITNDDVFKPELVLSNNLPSSYEVLSKKQLDYKRTIMVFSKNGLNIELLGDKPLGSWIPSDGARVKISYSKGMFPAAKTEAIINEAYTIQPSESELQTLIGMPLGDFLGPNVVLWSEDEILGTIADKELITPPSGAEHNRIVTVLLTYPPFSLRVSCIPEDLDAISVYKKFADKDKESEEDVMPAFRYKNDSGTVQIHIPDIHEASDDFDKAYSRMQENDVVIISNIHGDMTGIDPRTDELINKPNTIMEMEFRYPPIPPKSGLNIFGAFSYLKFTKAKGNLTMGVRSFDINAPSTLEFSDIEAVDVDGGRISVPIRWSPKEDHTDIQLDVTAKVNLNGESLNKGLDTNKQNIELILIACTILSTIGAIFPVVLKHRSNQTSRKRRK